MLVIAIVNQRGGAGRASTPASTFSEIDAVLLLDANPKGSARNWADGQSRR